MTDLSNPIFKCHISSLFAKEQYLWSCVTKIREMGIVTIGDFIDANPDLVLDRLATSNNNKDRIRRIITETACIQHLTP